jgi:hypothetical protein
LRSDRGAASRHRGAHRQRARFTLERIAPQRRSLGRAGEIPRELYREAARWACWAGLSGALGGTPAPHALRNAVSVTHGARTAAAAA